MRKFFFSTLIIITGIFYFYIRDFPYALQAAEQENQTTNDLLFNAVRLNDIDRVKAALKMGANPNYFSEKRYMKEPFKGYYEIVLNIAIQNKNLAMVKILVDAGAKVNPVEKVPTNFAKTIPMTPLIIAIDVNDPAIIRYLLEKGAYPESQIMGEFEWGTPLAYAVVKGSLQVVKILVEAGADVNGLHIFHGGFRDETPVSLAIKYRHLEIARFLVNKGATLNKNNTRASLWNIVKILNKDTNEYLKLVMNMKINPDVSLVEFPETHLTSLMYICNTCVVRLQAKLHKFTNKDAEYWKNNDNDTYTENEFFEICFSNIQFLVENGANVNAIYSKSSGYSVLYFSTTAYINPTTKTIDPAPRNIADRKEILKPQYFTPKMWIIIQYLIDHGAKF